MAYITTEEVKEIRNRIKAAYPAKKGWKFSIRQQDHSSLHVDILTAPIQMIPNGTHQSVNHYHIQSDVKFSDKTKAILNDISAIANETNWDKSDVQSDYFNCHFYYNMRVGNYDKPFTFAEGHSIEDKLEQLGF